VCILPGFKRGGTTDVGGPTRKSYRPSRQSVNSFLFQLKSVLPAAREASVNPVPLQPLLTLEPLIDAVRQGVEAEAWQLSGLQKTTSHQFEGRWAGDTSRSAYLFFHLPSGPEWAGVDVFLDETTEGLQGNLALVVEGCALGSLGDVSGALAALGHLALAHLPPGHRTPVTVRVRLEDGAQPTGSAATEFRFKLVIPRHALREGALSVAALASATVRAFRGVLSDPALARYLEP
jgi:hypothetical protein